MPKPSTFPTLLNDCKTLSIGHLSKWGFLEPDIFKSSILTFSSRGCETGKISIVVSTSEYKPYIEFNYTVNKEPINYKVGLIQIPSNLGKGMLWYFVCPKTYKLCRKLYLVGKQFLHREAFKGVMYESQTHSKKNRALNKLFDMVYADEIVYPVLCKKYFKTHYKGRPTKKYVKVMVKLKRAESCNISQAELMMM